MISIRMVIPISETNVSSSRRGRRIWPHFSDFRKLPETPPALASAELGAPFAFDIEKGMELEIQPSQVKSFDS